MYLWHKRFFPCLDWENRNLKPLRWPQLMQKTISNTCFTMLVGRSNLDHFVLIILTPVRCSMSMSNHWSWPQRCCVADTKPNRFCPSSGMFQFQTDITYKIHTVWKSSSTQMSKVTQYYVLIISVMNMSICLVMIYSQ